MQKKNDRYKESLRGYENLFRKLLRDYPDHAPEFNHVLYLITCIRLAVDQSDAREAVVMALKLAHAALEAQRFLIDKEIRTGTKVRRAWSKSAKGRQSYLARVVYPEHQLWRTIKTELKKKDSKLSDSQIANKIFLRNIQIEAERRGYKPKGEKWSNFELRKLFSEWQKEPPTKQDRVKLPSHRRIREVISDTTYLKKKKPN